MAVVEYLRPVMGKLAEARSPRQKEQAIELAIDVGFRQSYDCLSSLPVIEAAFATMHHGNKEYGLQLYKKMEEYFSENSPAMKRLLPEFLASEGEIREGIQQTQEYLNSIVGTITKLNHTPWFRAHFDAHFSDSHTHNFIKAIRETLDFTADLVPEKKAEMVVIAPTLFKELPDESSIPRIKDHTAKLLKELKLLKDPATERVWVRSNLLDILVDKKVKELPRELDFFKNIYGEVSLEDILNDNNPDHAGRSLLRFIASLPQGNYVWQRLLEGIFFVPLSVTEIQRLDPEQKELTTRIYRLQQWLADKCVFPAMEKLTPSEVFVNTYSDVLTPDTEFDGLFIQALQRMDGRNAEKIGIMLFQTFHNEPRIRVELGEDGNLASAIQVLPMAQLVLQESTPSDIVELELEIDRFLSRHEHLVEASWSSRFRPRKLLHYWDLVNGWQSQVTKLQVLDELGIFIKKGKEVFTFLDTWQESDLVALKDSIWQMTSGQQRVYWPHPDVDHEIKFPQNNPLSDWLDVEKVVFVTEQDFTKPVSFYIYFPDQTVGLAGKLFEDGRIEWINTKDTDNKISIFHLIVWASFRDLLKGAQIIIRQTDAKRARKKARTDVIDQSDKRTPLPLPRQRVIYEGTKAVRTDSAELVSVVERQRGNAAPVYIGAFKSLLPGRNQYQEAYRRWKNASAENREEAYTSLIEARNRLHQPRHEKIANQPAVLKLSPLVDTSTGEQLFDVTRDVTKPLWLETWVGGFRRPLLTEEEKVSLNIRFKRRYQGGSALFFIHNELTRLAVGIED